MWSSRWNATSRSAWCTYGSRAAPFEFDTRPARSMNALVMSSSVGCQASDTARFLPRALSAGSLRILREFRGPLRQSAPTPHRQARGAVASALRGRAQELLEQIPRHRQSVITARADVVDRGDVLGQRSA